MEKNIIRAIGACGDKARYKLYTNGHLVIHGEGKVSLSGIGGMETVNRIDVLKGITELDDYAFGICSNLQMINLPDTLETIGFGPFNGCDKLERLVIPKSVSKIADPVNLCKGKWLLSIDGVNPYYYIVRGAFFDARTQKMLYYRNHGETSFTVPVGTKEIADEVFFRANLKEIIFPEGVEVFDYYCLASNPLIESVTFPSTTKTLYEGVIDGCCNLNRIICLAPVPPQAFEDETFIDLNSNPGIKQDWFDTPLYVPSAAIDAYKCSPEWRLFKYIFPLEHLKA